MAREKFQTLTEQMFYILLCLQTECYGMDIMEKIRKMTNERISVGPGTLYNLLERFVKEGMIRETRIDGRKRSYLITEVGTKILEAEYQRIQVISKDYRQHFMHEGRCDYEDKKA